MAKKPNPELVKYIEKHLLKGYKLKQVKRKLAEVGHPIEAIEDAAQFVLSSKPHLKRRDWKFMIIYGLILIVILAGFVYFIATKTTQQMQYQEKVGMLERQKEFIGMTDVDLLEYAAANNDTSVCSMIKGHNAYYACVDKYWERDGWNECSAEKYAGAGSAECWKKIAVEEEDIGQCTKSLGSKVQEACRKAVIEQAISKGNLQQVCGRNLDCVLEAAKMTGDSSKCDFIEDIAIREDCFKFMADYADDSSLCDNIADSERKYGCLAPFVGSVSAALDFCEGASQTGQYAENFTEYSELEGMDEDTLKMYSCLHDIFDSIYWDGKASCPEIAGALKTKGETFLNGFIIYLDAEDMRLCPQELNKLV